MARDIDTRTITLVDLPLMTRLSDQAMVLDNEIGFTRDSNGSNGMVLSSVLLPHRNAHTLIARSGKRHVIGQFRVLEDNARITFITPDLREEDFDDRLWLHLLDAMAREGGKHGAHALIAEIDEDALLFETMRTCGFAVYARQQIWRRLPGDHPHIVCEATLREASDQDLLQVQSVVSQSVPPFMQQIDMPEGDLTGWLARNAEQIMAYIGVVEGKHGIYLTPYIHPDYMEKSAALLDGVIRRLDKADKLPVYVCVRRYQDWIASTLETLEFEPGPRQAVMVKHITAGIRQPVFTTVSHGIAVLAGGAGKPPTHRVNHWQENI
ncbi:MAG: hypothetical protein OHK0046_36330 [Anaerolineae bacterium]